MQSQINNKIGITLGRFLGRAGVHAAVYLTAATMLVPFLWMMLTSLKTSTEAGLPTSLGRLLPQDGWQWGNYVRAWEQVDIGSYYWMSTSVAVATTVLGVAHNALAGYAFAKLRFHGKKIAFGLVLATMMLPAQVFFLFAYWICRQVGYVDNFAALVVPFLASGFGVFYMRQVIMAVPDSLLEAGRIDGMRELDIFWVLVRPIVWPGVAALGIISFMNSWNNFFWPLIVIDSTDKKTLPLAIADLQAGHSFSDQPLKMAAATILVVPLVFVFLVAQRAFVRGFATSGLKE